MVGSDLWEQLQFVRREPDGSHICRSIQTGDEPQVRDGPHPPAGDAPAGQRQADAREDTWPEPAAQAGAARQCPPEPPIVIPLSTVAAT
jgi:hypothetical protein